MSERDFHLTPAGRDAYNGDFRLGVYEVERGVIDFKALVLDESELGNQKVSLTELISLGEGEDCISIAFKQ